MSFVDDLSQRGNSPQDIAHLGHCNQLNCRREHRLKDFHFKIAMLIHRNVFNGSPGAGRKLLPGNEIGMMFHFAGNDDITGFEIGLSPAIGYQVDTLGRIPGKDDFPPTSSIDKAADLLSSRLISGRSLFADLINPSMDIGMILSIIGVHGLDDRQRFLRTGGAIEINKRLTVDLLVQNREILANRFYVEHVKPSLYEDTWGRWA